MQLAGRRIHIAGSARPDTDETLLAYAHELIAALVATLGGHQTTFVVGVGKEPIVPPHALSHIFDWTVLATVSAEMAADRARPSGPQGRLVATVATHKTASQIPDARRDLWDALLSADAVRIEYVEPGWTSGAVRRLRLAQLGDILIAVSGGEGVEHLAREYSAMGKPVIPLDLDLGSSSDDGSGGAARLAGIALAHPERFVRLNDQDAAADLLARLSTRSGQVDPSTIAQHMVNLLHALRSPSAFYVRLLNPEVAEYDAVERFFRNVVDPVVEGFGYDPLEMGRGAVEYAWINEAIFESLHYAAVAIVDVTGLRPNCFMELGYAFGNAQRVILTAQKGTRMPFDPHAIDRHEWSDALDDRSRRIDLERYWTRTIDRPPLVKPRGLL